MKVKDQFLSMGPILALKHVMKLILGRYALLENKYCYKYCFARVVLCKIGEGSIFGALTLYVYFGSCYEVDILFC